MCEFRSMLDVTIVDALMIISLNGGFLADYYSSLAVARGLDSTERVNWPTFID